jgi:hypothetical protein
MGRTKGVVSKEKVKASLDLINKTISDEKG